MYTLAAMPSSKFSIETAIAGLNCGRDASVRILLPNGWLLMFVLDGHGRHASHFVHHAKRRLAELFAAAKGGDDVQATLVRVLGSVRDGMPEAVHGDSGATVVAAVIEEAAQRVTIATVGRGSGFRAYDLHGRLAIKGDDDRHSMCNPEERARVRSVCGADKCAWFAATLRPGRLGSLATTRSIGDTNMRVMGLSHEPTICAFELHEVGLLLLFTDGAAKAPMDAIVSRAFDAGRVEGVAHQVASSGHSISRREATVMAASTPLWR